MMPIVTAWTKKIVLNFLSLVKYKKNSQIKTVNNFD